jgi:very-long-chain enoyl-CoA reductase
VLADEGRSSTNVSELTFSVKDLGPQISWRTVFFVEYVPLFILWCPLDKLLTSPIHSQLGPLIIHPVVYHFSAIIYRQNFEHSQLQTVAYGLVLAHFLKRELETLL